MSAANLQAPPFAGYGRPRFTQTPNIFFDEQMQELTLSELRVMLYIFRRTFGFQLDGQEIPLSDFLHGWRAKDGRQLDKGAGVSEPSLLTALKSLEAKAFIFRHQQEDPEQGHRATYYELNIDGTPHHTPFCTPDCDPSPKTLGEASPKTLGKGGSPKTLGDPSPNNLGKLSIDKKKKERKNPPPTPTAHIPPAAPSLVVEVDGDSERVKTDTALLVSFGLDEETARECALVAERNGHLVGYVPEQIEYVQLSPGIKDPAAVLIANIQKNRRRKPPAQAAPPPLVLVPAPEPTEAADTPAPALLTLPTAPSLSTLIWNRALPYLKHLCPGEYEKTLRYVQLAEVEAESGTALLTVPNDHLRRAVERLADSISLALHQAGQPQLRIAVAIQQADQPRPTLAGGSPRRNTP